MASKSKCPTSTKSIVYLDNNATTLICKPAMKAYDDYLLCYNPSTNSKVVAPIKKMIAHAEARLRKHCNAADYTIIYTSGATESNCCIIRSTTEAYKAIRCQIPHVIISAVEHSSIMDCCSSMLNHKLIELTTLKPNIYGIISPESVKQAIRPNTCLISIMFANNETGAINDIQSIGRIAHQHKIPMHTDAVQLFGKTHIDMVANNIDALSASFHKFYGPKGIGLLIINNQLIRGYKLEPIINGHQQHGMRGGTMNPPSIAAADAALVYAFQRRKQKNAHMLQLRNALLDSLAKHYLCIDYKDYVYNNPGIKERYIVILSPPRKNISTYLPNTVLMSIIDHPFCNIKFRKYLDDKSIIVGIGSACLTDNSKASHVLSAINASPEIKRGTIRISFSDNTTQVYINKFIQALVKF